MGETATVLLVHGAWCGDWVYWKLTPRLEERGVQWVGADLPTCSATDSSIGPKDDATYVRELIDRIDGPVVVAGKSYGGIVISGATAGHPRVAHLVYIGGADAGRGRAVPADDRRGTDARVLSGHPAS